MRKPVYNERYYRVQAMLKNSGFKRDIRWLKSRFAHFGIPLPKSGFKKYAEYEEWNKRFWDKWSECDSSQEKKDAWAAFANKEGNIVGHKNYQRWLSFERDFYPPVYGTYLKDVLQEHGFRRDDKLLNEFMLFYVFFGRTEYLEPPFEIFHKRNQKTDEWELFIKILPWTTRDDVVKHWNHVEEEQAIYPEHIKRNKPWEFFDLHYAVYQAYEKAKVIKKKNDDKRRLDHIAYSLLEKKNQTIDRDSIRRIHKEAAKRLGLSSG